MKCAKCGSEDLRVRLVQYSCWRDAKGCIDQNEPHILHKVVYVGVETYCKDCKSSATFTQKQMETIKDSIRAQGFRADKILAHLKYEDPNQTDLFKESKQCQVTN